MLDNPMHTGAGFATIEAAQEVASAMHACAYHNAYDEEEAAQSVLKGAYACGLECDADRIAGLIKAQANNERVGAAFRELVKFAAHKTALKTADNSKY